MKKKVEHKVKFYIKLELTPDDAMDLLNGFEDIEDSLASMKRKDRLEVINEFRQLLKESLLDIDNYN